MKVKKKQMQTLDQLRNSTININCFVFNAGKIQK